MAHPGDKDTITIKGLQLPYGIVAPNIWGELKPQPGLLSLALTLNPGIGSAADEDALDHNTVHYGHLAKQVRGGGFSDLPLNAFTTHVEGVIHSMATREDGSFRLFESSVQLTLPKACMNGEGVQITHLTRYTNDGQSISQLSKFRFVAVKIMALIGVNSNERQAKQPLFVDMELQATGINYQWEPNRVAGFFGLEQKLVEIIQDTHFETLESLAVYILAQLQPNLKQMLSCSAVELRIDKPRAIPFADAPGVVVFRNLE